MAATAWAGLADLMTMRISNNTVLFLIAAYASLAPLAGLSIGEIGWSAAVALCVLVLMFGLFAMGWIGGGDAKLIPAISLWIGFEHTPSYLIYTALFGAVLTLLILQFRSRALPVQLSNIDWLKRLHTPRLGVPYGVAIAWAALFVFPQTRWVELWL
jgi:prepilin peptidase CpaA